MAAINESERRVRIASAKLRALYGQTPEERRAANDELARLRSMAPSVSSAHLPPDDGAQGWRSGRVAA